MRLDAAAAASAVNQDYYFGDTFSSRSSCFICLPDILLSLQSALKKSKCEWSQDHQHLTSLRRSLEIQASKFKLKKR